MEFHDVLHTRMSVRRFTSEPIPDHVIDSAIEAAVLAPSAHGRQPWRFGVVSPGATRAALVAAMGVAWRAHLLGDGTPPSEIERRFAASAERISAAPALLLACLDTSVLDVYPDAARQNAEYTMAVQSLGCAIQNLLLCVVDQGYHAGWMCAPLFCRSAVQTVCGLPATTEPHALIPIGRMAEPPKRRPKKNAALLRFDITVPPPPTV